MGYLLLVSQRRKETEEARFRGKVEKEFRTGALINSFNSQILNYNLTHCSDVSEFKYLGVVDKKPQKRALVLRHFSARAMEDQGLAEGMAFNPLKKYYLETDFGRKVTKLLLEFFDKSEAEIRRVP